MAAINVKTNLSQVNDLIQQRVAKLANPETILRPLCFDLIDLMTKRIHIDGKNSNGSQIGTYSNSYLRARTKKYKRTGDSKIIVSLTKQLENNWAVIATPKGFGIGFLNPFNYEKARWVENGATAHSVKAHTRNINGNSVKVSAHSNKGWVGHGPIFSLTDIERDYAISFINEKVNETLNG